MTPASTDVWSEFQGSLRSFVGRRVRTSADADDLVQEIFAKIHTNLPTLGDESKFRSWAYQIARHTIVDYHRKRGSAMPAEDVGEQLADEEGDGTVRADLLRCLARMIERLPDTYRDIIRMTELQGLTQEAAAQRLGLSLSGAKSRVQRGRERLRQMFDECCDFEVDRAGTVIDYERKRGGCPHCE